MPSIILDVYIVASVFNLNFLLHKLLVIFTDKPKEGKKKTKHLPLYQTHETNITLRVNSTGIEILKIQKLKKKEPPIAPHAEPVSGYFGGYCFELLSKYALVHS